MTVEEAILKELVLREDETPIKIQMGAHTHQKWVRETYEFVGSNLPVPLEYMMTWQGALKIEVVSGIEGFNIVWEAK